MMVNVPTITQTFCAVYLNKKERVMIPELLQYPLMEWFHENLSHPGQKRMYNTMATYYTWKGMKCDVENFVSTFVNCQKFKKTEQKKYAKLPLRDDIAPEPFYTLQVDLIGPWNVEIKQANAKVINIQLKALTIIDVGTFLLEIVPYDNKKQYP